MSIADMRSSTLTLAFDSADEEVLKRIQNVLRKEKGVTVRDISSNTPRDVITQAKRESTIIEMLTIQDGYGMLSLHRRINRTPCACSYKTLQRTVTSLELRGYLFRKTVNTGRGKQSLVFLIRRKA